MTSKTWLFEGEQRPFCDICAMVPALSRQTVRSRLSEGHTTRIGMLSRLAPKPKPTTRARSLYNRESAR